MGRRAKSAKGKLDAERACAGKPPKKEGSRVRDLEKRLAESSEREKTTGKLLQEKTLALTAALEQQTATSEILRVISDSRTDAQPVFDVIVRNAARLCDAVFSGVALRDGDQLTLPAAHGLNAADLKTFLTSFPIPLGPDTVSGRAILEGRVVHVRDQAAEPAYARNPGQRVGTRSIVAVPMLRNGRSIGAISAWRREVRPFTDKQIALLKTFADQAVIAIENVRLFKELEARTAELTRSVEKLTALGEVSQAVSSTLDLESVLATIVSRAVQLSGSYSGIVYEFDEATQSFHARATHQISPELLETLRATPIRLGEGAVGRAAVIRQPVEVADIEHGQLVAPSEVSRSRASWAWVRLSRSPCR